MIEAHDGSGSWTPIRHYRHIMIPDYVSWDNNGIPSMWNRLVNPPDLAAFVAAYQSGVGPPSCHDYDNDMEHSSSTSAADA